jgi:hypothetical protein
MTKEERVAKKIFDQAVKKWKKILMIDSMWSISVNIEDDEQMESDANVDIGMSEYFIANINVCRSVLTIDSEKLKSIADDIVCHELLHVATADFQRAVLLLSDGNPVMQNQMRYLYEQMVSRLSVSYVTLCNFSEQE